MNESFSLYNAYKHHQVILLFDLQIYPLVRILVKGDLLGIVLSTARELTSLVRNSSPKGRSYGHTRCIFPLDC